MREPTQIEMRLDALGIQDDVSWYNWRDNCVRQGYSSFEQEYQGMCKSIGFGDIGAVDGTSPMRIHNLAPNNIWGYDPGIECTYGLVFSGHLMQPQIEALNKCVPLETVLIAGGMVKETLKEVKTK